MIFFEICVMIRNMFGFLVLYQMGERANAH